MNRRNEFIDAFIVQFLATWVAKNYDEYCLLGIQNQLEKPPVEDAKFLAEKAWETFEKSVLS